MNTSFKACLTAVASVLLSAVGFAADTVESLIAQAGNANDDRERQVVLEKLATHSSLDDTRRKETAALEEYVRRWNESGLKFYNASTRGKPDRAIGDYDFGVAADSPLRPICELYRGRMLAWNLIENSNVRTNPKEAKWFKDEAVASFRRVAEAFPKNTVARMYLGDALPWGTTPEKVEGAPEWAALQREQLERMAEIIRWWITHRQRANTGEFGGGWGDDCEMWRWWSSVLLGFEDPKIIAAQLKFSRSAVTRPQLKGGFNTEISDVEHAAEDTTDNLVPLMVLEPNSEKWTKWGLKMGDFMRDVWTGKNERGQLQFKSFYFSATETAPQQQRAFDVIANVGALHPALLAWQKTGDEKLGAQICAWLDTWVDATARAENGKPAGILPASIRWPDGAAAGAEGRWWEPVKPGGYMHSYYIWPSVITEITDALMLAHTMTGKESYLAPLRSMAAIRLKHLKNLPSETPTPGSEAWCGDLLAPRRNANSNTGGLVKTLARFKALTGTTEFDELLALEGSEFVIRTDAAGRQELEAALRESLGALRVNFPGFTSEVRSTDRCMRFVQFLAQDYAFDDYKGVMQPKHELLYRMVTGDKNAPRFPQMAVRWLTPPQDIAALVTEASATRFTAELFHFGKEPRELSAELRQLRPGSYKASLTVGGKPVKLADDRVKVEKGHFSKLPFTLPAQALTVLTIQPTP
ncbi:hypothetical protein [Verrucomicrobium sp. BvORR034]|uniref:hypothetical protein n=1 Tax=Verrucomicrobium sp. BvORR034 TaxID=1396418 RepID=UPI0006792122|nr:hypothetical protein [Verrucomicrobium sp. BvORR034]